MASGISSKAAGAVERVAARVRTLVGRPDPDAKPVSQAPALKIFGAEPEEAAPPRLAAVDEARASEKRNLHAGIAFEAHERVAIECLCRYILRGPLGRLGVADGASDAPNWGGSPRQIEHYSGRGAECHKFK